MPTNSKLPSTSPDSAKTPALFHLPRRHAANIAKAGRMNRAILLGAVAVLALGAAILQANAAGQTHPSAKSVENQLEPLHQLILDNRLDEAERLVRSVLPTPEAAPKQTGGFLNLSAYDVVWGMIANRYLTNNDYASAERVASERLKLAQSAAPTDPYRIQLFTFVLANAFLTQGNYAKATPLYQRLISADTQNDLSADFQVKSNTGMTEALMAQGRAAEAVRFLKPMVFAEGADPARPAAFHEELFNTYAVALMEAGQSAAADQIVAQIGRESSRPAGFDQQDRDLLRARLLRARGLFDEAESIYREWIKHWDDRPPASGSIQRDLAEARLKPLEEYTHFLTLRRRSPEAQAARARLRMLEREYNATF